MNGGENVSECVDREAGRESPGRAEVRWRGRVAQCAKHIDLASLSKRERAGYFTDSNTEAFRGTSSHRATRAPSLLLSCALCCVRHDRHVAEPLLIERLAERADAAIHHIRGADAVGTGAGLRDSLLAEVVNGLVVHDDA